jgi:hypothetical protein
VTRDFRRAEKHGKGDHGKGDEFIYQGNSGFERDFSAGRDAAFASKLAPTGKCIPNVGASALAKGPEKSAQNAF